MSCKIYTYSNPYEMNREEFWESIYGAPYFCATQTLINGLRKAYSSSFGNYKGISTIRKLINNLYTHWNSTSAYVNQFAIIEKLINDGLFNSFPNGYEISKSFITNQDAVLSSIRTLFELDVNEDNIISDVLTDEQLCLVELYRKLKSDDFIKYFSIANEFSAEDVQQAIENTLLAALPEGEELDERFINSNKIIIHGVHQFPAIYLRGIEEIAKYKEVIFLFNYQENYKHTYQTWIDIYSAFDAPLIFSNNKSICTIGKNSHGFLSNQLALSLGNLLEGNRKFLNDFSNIDVLEFENDSEFADYVAGKYMKARDLAKDNESPLYLMNEQFYGASSNVNDLLKIYFPEQFGKRNFLDYPAGRFITNLAEMWDVERNALKLDDLDLLKECISSKIVYEDKNGELINIFNKAESLFIGCSDLDTCITRLRTIRKEYHDSEIDEIQLNRISYCSLDDKEIQKLEIALLDIEKISISLFSNFEIQSSNIKRFYANLEKLFIQRIVKNDKFSNEFKEMTEKILSQMKESESVTVSSTFNCLKSTFPIYLTEEFSYDNSANWIVRNLEQVEGDILRTKYTNNGMIYHFSSLSDEEICSNRVGSFSWPLNPDFFVLAQNPVDWKYQVYVNSSIEYKNYKKFAFLFALSNNYSRVKLSYVKKTKNRENSLYYPLIMLGLNLVNSNNYLVGEQKGLPKLYFEGFTEKEFGILDLYRFRQCKFKFLLESLIEGETVYKDSFMQTLYLRVLLESLTKESLDGRFCDEDELYSAINKQVGSLRKFYPQAMQYVYKDAIKEAINAIDLGDDFEYTYTDEMRLKSTLKEIFLRTNIKEKKKFNSNVMKSILTAIPPEEIDSFNSKIQNITSFIPEAKEWCLFCANKEICAKLYEK